MSSKTAKTPTNKTSTKAVKTTARKTIASVSTDLIALESRLKRADKKNRTALKSLEGVVSDLQTATKTSNSTQKAALTRGLSSLESRMETYLNRASQLARAGVREELAAVTAPDAGIDTLGHAVKSAHARLDKLDTAQRESIARLNRHVSGLAISVEKHLNREASARKSASAALDKKIDNVQKSLESRVDQVELETANALESIGDKVAEFATVLEQRSNTSDAETAERLADLAQETQSEFDTVNIDVTTRLEALEVIASNWSPVDPVFPANMEDPRVDQMAQTVEALQQELRRMHARVALLQVPTEPLHTPVVSNPVDTDTNVLPMLTPTNNQPAAPEPTSNPYSEAALALQATTASIAVDSPPQRPKFSLIRSRKRTNHVPTEFDPNTFESGSPTQMPPPQAPQTLAPLPTLSQPPIAAPSIASPETHFSSAGSVPTHGAMNDIIAPIDPIMPAPMPVSTYANPAYAEGQDMLAERVGGNGGRKKSSLSQFPVSGRNLRVGALAASLAVVGIIAGKTLLSGEGAPNLQAKNDARPAITAPASETSYDLGTSETPATAAAPLGRYAETQTPDLQPQGQLTLDSAVAAGDPIAQFQKGLVKLQTGQVKDGARLIRLAANRNQPAAQYRLAKLYESGTGLTKDLVTARELVERAAFGGNRIAMHDLGNYYAYGQGGLDRDMGQALDWFSKAAERGVVDSQFNVAFLREGNEGVSADAEAALFWYYVAARQGDQGAPERISVLSAQLDDATQADIKSRAQRFNPKPVDEAANGIFRNVPWAKTARAVDPVKAAQIVKIRETQTLLTNLGYQIGAADGAAGPKTRAAIKQFEAVNGLPETGQVTDELVERLAIASGA